MFKSHGYRADSKVACADGSLIDLRELPPFLRTLLVADGTVTKSLEAYFWQPISVKPLHQCVEALEHSQSGLPAEVGDEVMRREVLLQGTDNEQVYAAARSYLWLDKLSPELREALELGKIGIGELLREQGIETYREIIELQYLHELPPEDELLMNISMPAVARSYRIRVSGEPAFLVTEYFPLDQY